MGCVVSVPAPREYAVSIHVYKLLDDGGKSLLGAMAKSCEDTGRGAYHTGVEIDGKEYAYGRLDTKDLKSLKNLDLTGVWVQKPKVMPKRDGKFRRPFPIRGHASSHLSHRVPIKGRTFGLVSLAGWKATYKETIAAGTTPPLSRAQLNSLMRKLKCEWKGREYARLTTPIDLHSARISTHQCTALRGVTASSTRFTHCQPCTLRALICCRYDLMRRNCNHWSEALCAELGVQGPPEYINKVSAVGSRPALSPYVPETFPH